MRAWLNRRFVPKGFADFASRYRAIFLLLAVVLFLSGLVLSVRAINIGFGEVRILPLAVNLLLLSPLVLFLYAWGLQLTARTLSCRIDFRTAVFTTTMGMVAEVLPVPAGMVARATALVRAGATPLETAGVLSMNALLWLGLSAVAGSFALLQVSGAAGLLLLAAGLTGVLLSFRWLASRANARLMFVILVHRIASLLLIALRIGAAFLALQAYIPLPEAAFLASANALGSVSSVVPAGLGLGEALAALAAKAVALSPAIAFAAVALNRVLVLLVAGLCAVLMYRRKSVADGAS